MPKLPDQTFDEIAAQLLGYANGAREAATCGAVWAEMYGGSGLSHSVRTLERDAVTAGQLYEFFRAAAPHEELIRDFLAGLEAETAGTVRGAA